MNKAFYITTLALSFIFLIICGIYIEEVSSARSAAFFDMMYSSDYLSGYSSSYTYDNSSDLTEEVGLIALPFFLFFLATDILGIIKIKTKTIKVLGIIGLVISSLFLLWDLMMIGNSGAMSFDEIGPAFILYALLVMAFAIVGLIQSIKYKKAPQAKLSNADILD